MRNKVILVSLCLLGVRSRYDGGDAYLPEIYRIPGRFSIVGICPEVFSGLKIPHPPLEISPDFSLALKDGKKPEKYARIPLTGRLRHGSVREGLTLVSDEEFKTQAFRISMSIKRAKDYVRF